MPKKVDVSQSISQKLKLLCNFAKEHLFRATASNRNGDRLGLDLAERSTNEIVKYNHYQYEITAKI